MTPDDALQELKTFFMHMALNAHGRQLSRRAIECLLVLEMELQRLRGDADRSVDLSDGSDGYA